MLTFPESVVDKEAVVMSSIAFILILPLVVISPLAVKVLALLTVKSLRLALPPTPLLKVILPKPAVSLRDEAPALLLSRAFLKVMSPPLEVAVDLAELKV